MLNEDRKILIKYAIGFLADAYDLPENAIQPEMFDFLHVVSAGAKKYAMNNWLEPNGKSTSEADMFNKISRHSARSFANPGSTDSDTLKDHLLNVQCRAAMLYTRRSRGIVHPEDEA